MGSKTLVEGTSYDIKRGKIKVDGAEYTIYNGVTLVDGTKKEIFLSKAPLRIGTTWTWFGATKDMNWECPEGGQYSIEVHGGGGGGAPFGMNTVKGVVNYRYGGGGGGSGRLITVSLHTGKKIWGTIGKGALGSASIVTFSNGSYSTQSPLMQTVGEDTILYTDDTSATGGGSSSELAYAPGGWSTTGTDGGQTSYYGSGTMIATAGNSGAIITDLSTSIPSGTGVGGYGNKDNPSQTWGSGGNGNMGVPDETYTGNGTQYVGQDGHDGAVIITYLGK